MFSICILFFAVILYVMDRIFFVFKIDSMKLQNLDSTNRPQNIESKNHNFKTKKILKYLIVIILFLTALFVPFYEGFSLIILCYSLFDSISIFCALMLLFLCVKIIYKDFALIKPKCDVIESKQDSKTKLDSIESNLPKPRAFALFTIIATLGFALYAHTLNLTNIDIYHASPLIHALIALLTLSVLYKISKIYALLALIALIPSIFTLYNYSILEFLICPYLWIFSLFYMLATIIMTPFYALK